MAKSADSDALRLMGSPEKSKKSGGKGSVALLKEFIQLGYVSQDFQARNICYRKKENWDRITISSSPRARCEGMNKLAPLRGNLLFYGKGTIGIESHRHIIQGYLAPHQNSGNKGSMARSCSTHVHLLSAIRALPVLRKDHRRRPFPQERCDPHRGTRIRG